MKILTAADLSVVRGPTEYDSRLVALIFDPIRVDCIQSTIMSIRERMPGAAGNG